MDEDEIEFEEGEEEDDGDDDDEEDNEEGVEFENNAFG